MEDIKRILVVSRMTKFDRKAFHYGVTLARVAGAELFLMHIVQDAAGADRLREFTRAQEGLRDLVKQEQVRGLHVRELVKEGPPVDAIVNTAVKERIDLLIMPAHEEGKIGHYLFCRGTDEIIKKLPCSILLVQDDD